MTEAFVPLLSCVDFLINGIDHSLPFVEGLRTWDLTSVSLVCSLDFGRWFLFRGSLLHCQNELKLSSWGKRGGTRQGNEL